MADFFDKIDALIGPLEPFLDGFWFYVLGAFVIVLPLIAAILSFAVIRHRRNAIVVTVKVTQLREGTDSDDGITYAPVFDIIDGSYAGTTWMSHVASSAPDHAVGDILTASYNPKTGVIHSGKTIGGYRFIAIGMVGMGMLLLYVFAREY